MSDKELSYRLNVRVPRELLVRARIRALQEGTNLSEIVRGFLTSYVAPEETKREQETK